ncbi:Uncharacterized protein APZ42_007534, partial [Daphnia magna]
PPVPTTKKKRGAKWVAANGLTFNIHIHNTTIQNNKTKQKKIPKMRGSTMTVMRSRVRAKTMRQ